MARSAALQAVSVLFAFFAIGVPYWMTPYPSVALPDTLVGPGLAALAAVGLVIAWTATQSLRVALLLMAGCPAAAVAVRIFFETGPDPSSHTLWPVELLIALVLGGAAVAPAAMLRAGRKLLGRSRPATAPAEG